MDGFLRQSTAVDLPLGKFVDATDGVTSETALAIAQADVRLKKNNGAWAQINDSTAATHEENGWYEKEFDATDTNTLGLLWISVDKAGAAPVWHVYMVIPAPVYDALIAGTDTLTADVTQWTGTNVASPDTAGYPKVTVKSGTGTGEVSLASGLVTLASTGLSNIVPSEPSAPPTWASSIVEWMAWIGALGRNKMTQTSTTTLLRNDADSGTIGTSTVSDDGTTFTRGEFS